MQSYRIRSKRQLATKLTPLVDPRMYSNTQMSDSRRSHHEELMRRSMHRLVSETTRYDRVTGKSLTLLGDIARLYLMRIGEACRARADFANRIDPNLLDVMECTSQELGVDWTSTLAWLSEWKGELGETVITTQPPVNGTSSFSNERPSNHDDTHEDSAWTGETWVETDHADDAFSRRLLPAGIERQHSGRHHHGMHSEPEGTSTVCNTDGSGDDIDDMIGSLNLSCFLLDDMDMADGIKGAIPSHLPPLVSLGGLDDLVAMKESQSKANRQVDNDARPTEEMLPDSVDDTETSENKSAISTQPVHDERLPETADDAEEEADDDDAEETPENVIAQIIHLTSSSLSVLPPSVKSDKVLYGFYRPATKFDSSCVPEENMPDFDISDFALVPAAERVESELSQVEKIQPGHPMFLIGDVAQRDIIGDSEEVWRQARYGMYQDIHDDAACKAFEEMNNAPEILRRTAADDKKEREEEEEERQKKKAEEEEEEKGNEMDTTVANIIDTSGFDINIDEDIVDIDMGVDMDLGLDLNADMDLDIDGHSQEDKGSQPLHMPESVDISNAASGSSADRPQPTEIPVLVPEDDHVDMAVTMDMDDDSEANMEEELADEPEVIPMPISSGLRGSGNPNWSSDWFTESMRKRLSRITAQDIVPCDSLFLSNPWASHRGVVDEVARAFVNSEGGGHLHKTTPIEGFGPAEHTYKVPSSSGSSLRWTLQHIMQTKGTSTVDSLYTGRSSLAGGVSGDGVTQYVDRMCSLIKASAEEEAEMVVSGSFTAAKDKDSYAWADRKVRPGQIDLMEQLLSGAEKRIPWAQNRLDIHVIESRIAGREPQRTETKPFLLIPSVGATADPTPDTAESSTPAPDADSANIDDTPNTVADDVVMDVDVDADTSIIDTDFIPAEAILAEDVADREAYDYFDADIDDDVDVDAFVDVDIDHDNHSVDGVANETAGGPDSPAHLALEEQQPEIKSSPVLRSSPPASELIDSIDAGGDIVGLDNQATGEDRDNQASVLTEYTVDEKGEEEEQQQQQSPSSPQPPLVQQLPHPE
ncbi:hypothetical protein EV175_001649 [Coemansia sp. RSA 1933]|nr:hypothetical protein EV175_001649 [Coemansia sp. RSA 1933]